MRPDIKNRAHGARAWPGMNTDLIIINPAYALKNTTHHIVSYSSWLVCILYKNQLPFSKHLETKTPNFIIECIMYTECHATLLHVDYTTYFYSAIACYQWYLVTRYKADGSGIIQYHFHLWHLTTPHPPFSQYHSSFLLAIVLPVLLRFTFLVKPFGIFKPVL